MFWLERRIIASVLLLALIVSGIAQAQFFVFAGYQTVCGQVVPNDIHTRPDSFIDKALSAGHANCCCDHEANPDASCPMCVASKTGGVCFAAPGGCGGDSESDQELVLTPSQDHPIIFSTPAILIARDNRQPTAFFAASHESLAPDIPTPPPRVS